MSTIPADVKEYPESYAFVLEMPGLKVEDIKVEVVDNNKSLLVSGEHKRETEEGVKYGKIERKVGILSRNFPFPDNADANSISTVYNHGLLTVTVDKLEPKKPKIIAIKIA